MPEIFCISVLFHDARFHGQADEGAPEWPPSPLRLYQAIVAACAACDSLCDPRPALLWFEQQPAPTIVGPSTHPSRPYRIAVPNNDLDVPARYWAKGQEAPKYKNPQDLKSMKTIAPAYLDGGDTLHYLYTLPNPLPQDVAAHVERLTLAARSVTHFGWGIDMVAAHGVRLGQDDAARLPGRRWKPVAHSATRLRAPQSGVLDALIRRHDAFLDRITPDGFTPVSPLAGFKVVSYDDANRVNQRPFAAFDLVPVEPTDHRPRRSFRQEDAIRVAAMLRHTAWEAAKHDLGDWRTAEWAGQFVAGHGPHDAADSFPRFSYVPLPTIASSHADGMIRRALLAETPGGDGRSAAWAQRRLEGLALCDEVQHKNVAFLGVACVPGDAVFAAYCGASDKWQTITPVILPGFDDNSRAKRIKLLFKCLAQVGIPANLVADFDVQRSPWLRASAPTQNYQRSERLEHLPACHIRVYFNQPITGPLIIGAGRHRGLGLLAAMD